MARTDMEEAIMDENESKYHQTQDMPFMQAPLLQDFGYLGLSPHYFICNRNFRTFVYI